MSKINARIRYSYQWKTDSAFCKQVARMAAALIENASDPFYYIRMVNYFQRGIEKAHDVNDYVKGRMDALSNKELTSLTGRVGLIIKRDGT